MSVFLISFAASLVVLGVLTFVYLTAGIGIFSGSIRIGGIQICCFLAAIAWLAFCTSYAGMTALAGGIAADIAIFVAMFLKKRH